MLAKVWPELILEDQVTEWYLRPWRESFYSVQRQETKAAMNSLEWFAY